VTATRQARAWLATPRGRLARRSAGYALVLGALGLVASLSPTLVHRLEHGDPAWLVAAGAFEVGSCLGFILLFRAAFRERPADLDNALAVEIASVELGASAVLPTMGVAGVALGAWALRRAGKPAEWIAERSVAFLILQNGVFVVGTAIIGAVLLIGPLPGQAPRDLVLLPFVVSLVLVAIVLVAAALGVRDGEGGADGDGGRVERWLRLFELGSRDAVRLLRVPSAVVGASAYAVLDFTALWCAFHAFPDPPSVSILMLGYLLGQGASVVPLPAGVGAVETGMIGTLVILNVSGVVAAAGVLAYRALALGIPAIWGGVAYLALRRSLAKQGVPDPDGAPDAVGSPRP
jgi:uncharacterized membrane protein YbhN (UPF0104 family)